jgi:hypothetical protein
VLQANFDAVNARTQNSSISIKEKTMSGMAIEVPEDVRFVLELDERFFKAHPEVSVFCRPVHQKRELWQSLFADYLLPQDPYMFSSTINHIVQGHVVMRVRRLEKGIQHSLVVRRHAVFFQADFFMRDLAYHGV